MGLQPESPPDRHAGKTGMPLCSLKRGCDCVALLVPGFSRPLGFPRSVAARSILGDATAPARGGLSCVQRRACPFAPDIWRGGDRFAGSRLPAAGWNVRAGSNCVTISPRPGSRHLQCRRGGRRSATIPVRGTARPGRAEGGGRHPRRPMCFAAPLAIIRFFRDACFSLFDFNIDCRLIDIKPSCSTCNNDILRDRIVL
jgi:hypothetical protein